MHTLTHLHRPTGTGLGLRTTQAWVLPHDLVDETMKLRPGTIIARTHQLLEQGIQVVNLGNKIQNQHTLLKHRFGPNSDECQPK